MVLKPEKYVGSLVLRRYRLDSVISSGGMGILYRATHLRTGRQVALKFLLDRDDNGRFELEARAAAELKHPNVVDVLDMDEDEDGVAFLALELLQGRSLAELLQGQERLSPEQLMAWLLPIMGALAVAHDRGILHRDLKPANIFIANTGGRTVPKLLDFGVAKVQSQPTLTRSGSVVGTPSYMSPEQARGDRELLAASDVWGMGVIWFRCLTGRLPFEHEAVIGTLMRIVNERAPRLESVVQDVPRALGWAIDRALQYDAGARYPDMRMFARTLLAAGLRENIVLPISPDPEGLPDWPQWLSEEKNMASTGTVPRAPVELVLVPSQPPPLPSLPPLPFVVPAPPAADPRLELAPTRPSRPVELQSAEPLAAGAVASLAATPAIATPVTVAPVAAANTSPKRSKRSIWLLTAALIAFLAGVFVFLRSVEPDAGNLRAPDTSPNSKPTELRLTVDPPPSVTKSQGTEPAGASPSNAKPTDPIVPGAIPSDAIPAIDSVPAPAGSTAAAKPVATPEAEAKPRVDRRKRRDTSTVTPPKPAPGPKPEPNPQDDLSIETNWR